MFVIVPQKSVLNQFFIDTNKSEIHLEKPLFTRLVYVVVFPKESSVITSSFFPKRKSKIEFQISLAVVGRSVVIQSAISSTVFSSHLEKPSFTRSV